MPAMLKNLVITKVALVDEGSCSEAHIQLYKRKPQNSNSEGGNQTMTLEEIMKSLPEEQQKVLKAKMDTMETELSEEKKKAAEAAKKKLALQAELDKMKKVDEDTTVNKSKDRTEGQKSEEDILKGLDPAIREIVQKSRLQAQAAEMAVKKMKEDQLHRDAIEKAKNLEALGTPEDMIEVVKALNALGEKGEAVYEALAKANTKLSAQLFTEAGSSAGSTDSSADAWGKIEKCATAIAKSKNIPQAQAVTEVIQNNPDLYNDYLQSQYK